MLYRPYPHSARTVLDALECDSSWGNLDSGKEHVPLNHLTAAEARQRTHGTKTDRSTPQGWKTGSRAGWPGSANRSTILLAVQGQKTLENTLRPYDDAVATLSAAGSLASLLDSVYPDKAVRDKARELTQVVAEAAPPSRLTRRCITRSQPWT